MSQSTHKPLKRVLGLPGGVIAGLGSMLGTGIYIIIPWVVLDLGWWALPAILIAGALATCNGLSSAQLAAAYPVSGGTYEYGYRLISPQVGFLAGSAFLMAKSASVAAAGLAIGMLLNAQWGIPVASVFVAWICTGVIALLIASGIKKSIRVNAFIVAVALGGLFVFCIWAYSHPADLGSAPDISAPAFLESIALLFVAYTGYGRIATLGEEIKEPQKNIPRAIIVTMCLVTLIYIVVAIAVLLASPIAAHGDFALLTGIDWLDFIISIGVAAALLNVILNLLLGLSRMALAMGRRGDLPSMLAKLNHQSEPIYSIFFVFMIASLLAFFGGIADVWSFSAVAVLVYYGICNLAALKMDDPLRLYPKWVPCLGLVLCLSLFIWIEMKVMFIAIGMLGLSFVFRYLFKGMSPKPLQQDE